MHFEIPTDDLARAKEFYDSVFEWQLQDMQGNGPSSTASPSGSQTAPMCQPLIG